VAAAPTNRVLEELDASAPTTVQESPPITALRARVEALELQLSEHVSAIDSLQERFQARSNEARLYLKERDEALAAAKTADARREDHLATIASLKQDRSRLEATLSETSKTLEASTVPEIAALEKARAETRAATAAQQKAEKRLESIKKDFEFTRQQYQTVSTAAVESANEVCTLKEENEKLQKQASGEILKLRDLNAKEADSADTARIRFLEAMLEDREAIIVRKEDELKNIGRGRGLATRATSVPRSPKAFSRPTSPAPGLFLGPAAVVRGGGGHVGFHPLRNG
jgi:chromosome segregation ATPase